MTLSQNTLLSGRLIAMNIPPPSEPRKRPVLTCGKPKEPRKLTERILRVVCCGSPYSERGRASSLGKKPVYKLLLRRRREIKRFLQEFPPLMASRQKKAAEFLLWDRYYKRHFPKGSDSVLQQAMDILDNSQGQGRLL